MKKNQNQKGYPEEVQDLVENQTHQSHQNQKDKLMRKTKSMQTLEVEALIINKKKMQNINFMQRMLKNNYPRHK